ncbi:MAG: phosphate acyltransferase PlsX [Proteobacteria bacterium]|nr:phosphate acyltransferase PlsX [Pseudomonadota bacterium]MBU1716845.1 phosphate acyltransferase PlsX [Pseudomonadota bacterium]
MHIALDAMGSDRAPEVLVAGALQAVDEAEIEVVLLGDESVLRTALKNLGRESDERIKIVHASQVIGMDESPIVAVRQKKDSSVVKAFDLLKIKEVDAVVSAGNSGATMAAAIKSLGRLKGIARPGIAGLFPTLKRPVVMMDVGANVDCRPKHLFQFGIMAAAFSEVLFNVKSPRIGILSNGEEGGKGNVLVKNAHRLFQQSSLNYIGNIEGDDTFQGDVDVITCDGFVGNVCLKISEGLAEAITLMLKDELSKTLKAKLGYLLTKDAFAEFKKRIDYAEYGGAPLLGLNGTSIICHGRSNSTAIKNAIFVAAELVQKKVNDRILVLLAENSAIQEEAHLLVDETLDGDAQ